MPGEPIPTPHATDRSIERFGRVLNWGRSWRRAVPLTPEEIDRLPPAGTRAGSLRVIDRGTDPPAVLCARWVGPRRFAILTVYPLPPAHPIDKAA